MRPASMGREIAPVTDCARAIMSQPNGGQSPACVFFEGIGQLPSADGNESESVRLLAWAKSGCGEEDN